MNNISTVCRMGLVAFALIVLLCGIFESSGLSWKAYLFIGVLEIALLIFLTHRLDKLQREQWERERRQKKEEWYQRQEERRKGA